MRTWLVTNYQASLDSKGKIKKEERASSDHNTIWEADNLDVEVQQVEAPETSGDGEGFQHGPAYVDFLECCFHWKKECLTMLSKQEPKLFIKKIYKKQSYS